MANKINFITGETYTLAELFSEERRIIIPDLQRDYCWGNENNEKSSGETGELVSDFVKNLIELFNESLRENNPSSLNLGLFYGYEVPTNHIQLCDGQQRLTTLYLLLGMLNKRTGKFRQNLISDFEFKHDDKEPYLNYAIRESSLYFISDLTCNFFIDNNEKVEKIMLSDWYFDEYNLDPSIQSIINALRKIELLIEDNKIDLKRFGDWVLNKLTFLYFDMENRKNGEETFVVINTTGEPLSATQNLKPLVIQETNNKFNNKAFSYKNSKGVSLKIDRCWEDIETWFWMKRQGDNDTADAGFAEFLRWVTIIEMVDIDVPENKKSNDIKKLHQLILKGKDCNFPYNQISFDTIFTYWKALQWISKQDSKFNFEADIFSPSWKEIDKNVFKNAISQGSCFVLLPLLKFVKKNIDTIETDPIVQRNAQRIYQFFKNIIRIDNVSKAVNSLVQDAIHIIDQLTNNDIVSLVYPIVNTSISKQILTEEEVMKLNILASVNNRNEIEEAFWEAQSHKIWNGEIMNLIYWSTINGSFDISLFKGYYNIFTEIFGIDYDGNIDIVRRALLTRKLKEYPQHHGTNYSLIWNASDWHRLIACNSVQFKSFFDALRSGISLSDMICSMTDDNDKMYRIVKQSDILRYSRFKNIQKWDNSWCVVKQTRATSFIEIETLGLYLDYRSIASFKDIIALKCEEGINYRGWKMWMWDQYDTALVFDKTFEGNTCVAIDIRFNRKKTNDWEVQLFLRNTDIDIQTKLKTIASIFNLSWNGERYEKRELSRQEAVLLINKLLGMVIYTF